MNTKRPIASLVSLAIVGVASIVYAAMPTITGVTAQQRYPWNGKVDISYTVTGDIAEEAKQQAVLTSLKVSAIDMVANTTITATQLLGDLAWQKGLIPLSGTWMRRVFHFLSSHPILCLRSRARLRRPCTV